MISDNKWTLRALDAEAEVERLEKENKQLEEVLSSMDGCYFIMDNNAIIHDFILGGMDLPFDSALAINERLDDFLFLIEISGTDNVIKNYETAVHLKKEQETIIKYHENYIKFIFKPFNSTSILLILKDVTYEIKAGIKSRDNISEAVEMIKNARR